MDNKRFGLFLIVLSGLAIFSISSVLAGDTVRIGSRALAIGLQNENDNVNENGNANENTNENSNSNVNENANENGNSNDNENENGNENSNSNENSNANENSNENSSDNENENSNDNHNSNDNECPDENQRRFSLVIPNQNDNSNDNSNDNENGNDNENSNDNSNDNENSNDNHNSNDDDDCDEEDAEAYGYLIGFPSNLIGDWSIDGLTVTADDSTEFDEDDGEFAVGQCVEIEYDPETLIAFSIETDDPYKCNGDSFTNRAYGTIDSYPTDLVGAWIIDDIFYVATEADTDFIESEGEFQIGACVEIKYLTLSGLNRALRIETEDGTGGCGRAGSATETSKLYAFITTLPDGAPDSYLGSWNIGGERFEADGDTEFNEDLGNFAVNVCVEAEYRVLNGINTLSEVETEQTYKCQLGTGGNELSSYGVVEAIPESVDQIGGWQISGITYLVDSSTELSQEYGFFAVGSFVEVIYVLDDADKRALKIETHVAPGAGATIEVGVVESYDATDDWADWVIDGVTYKADPVIEVNGAPAAPETVRALEQDGILIGESVLINSYERNGIQYLTSVSVATESYLPMTSRP